MATAYPPNQPLQVFMYYCPDDSVNANELKEHINANSAVNCFGVDRSPGKNKAECLARAINDANHFIIFLSCKLLENLAYITAIVSNIKEDINKKLIIVLNDISKDEFTNDKEKRLNLTISRENVIYSPRQKWDEVAQQIFRNLNLNSASLPLHENLLQSGKSKFVNVTLDILC